MVLMGQEDGDQAVEGEVRGGGGALLGKKREEAGVSKLKVIQDPGLGGANVVAVPSKAVCSLVISGGPGRRAVCYMARWWGTEFLRNWFYLSGSRL
jgi:hypothetical protein